MTADRSTRPLIYHLFADRGVESEVLGQYGRVVRVGLDPRANDVSEAVCGDATELPLRPDADLAVWHPPCAHWSRMTRISGDPAEHPDLIDDARQVAQRVADEYVIENVPAAPLHDPVVLDGRMFGLPIRCERAFETSFHVEQPARYASLSDEAETSPYFFADRSRDWWAVAKGYSPSYPKEHLAKNSIPAPYIRHLLRCWLVECRDGARGADYQSHDELDVAARREKNHTLPGVDQ